nr:tetratricopeptide repeat protein [Desulfobacula sp.]
MMRSNLKMVKILQILVISGLLFSAFPDKVWAAPAVIRNIDIQKDPLSVKIFLNRDIAVKVVRVGKKEVLIALTNATLGKGFKIKEQEKSLVQKVAVEKMQGNVIAVLLTGHHPYEHMQSGFNKADSSFVLTLEKKGEKKKTGDTVSEKKEAAPPLPEEQESLEFTKPGQESPKGTDAGPESELKKIPGPKEEEEDAEAAKSNEAGKLVKDLELKKPEKIPVPPVYVPPKREQSGNKGDISDLLKIMSGTGCDSDLISNSLLLLKKELYQEAFDSLDQYIIQGNATCLEKAHFLKAHAFLQTVKKDDFAQLLKAERMYQDALVSYPKSPYVPYAYSAIGIIQKQMNNIAAAEGYFNIVKRDYLDYSGLPEVIYHLADIYEKKGFLDKALTYYKQVFEDTIENSHIPDAGIGYGRALYEKRQYLDSLSVLNYVVESNPDKVYKTHELLQIMGNANFEIGQSKAARDILTRLLNLFPDLKDPDIILSKIGDTYGMDNNDEKAVKIYELVRQKYPDTEGYIASSIGIARHVKSDQEKIDIYEMIKKKFPENTYSRIAMMRLAEIYQANGDYGRCIKEIESLLLAHPRGLRYEAIKLMQKAYEAMFQKQLKSNEFTQVLNRYELEHPRIDRMGSRKIALSVGLSYLDAKLYDESFNHLISAYKQYDKSSRPPELLFGLGVAMDESGRDEDALKILNAFSNQFPKNENRVETLIRAGNIYLEKKEYQMSSDKFKDAHKISKSHLEKGKILMMHSSVYEKKGDMKTASDLREEAAKEIALASGENYELLTEVYKELGQSYSALKNYVRAADAYQKALALSNNDQEKANLGFLLGDAYQKGNILLKAKEAFKQVVASYDSVWARLAQQRLNTLELAETVQNS